MVAWEQCSQSPEQVLVERFHITTGFHAGQREIIERLIQGQRVLAIQHTGWGKSLCFQVSCLYHPHLTIVFSPLKALMREQAQRCNERYALPAAALSSDCSPSEKRTILARAIAGELKLLFIAPERMSDAFWQSALARIQVSMIVIDEAHCISTWGHDFRPYYRRIMHFLKTLSNGISLPVLALTATANKRVEQDICQQMGWNVAVVRGSMYRPNLYINTVRVTGDWEKLAYLGEVLSQRSDNGIIYTATQRSAEMVAMFLGLRGIKAEYYHAGREDTVRYAVEQKWMTNEYTVLCTTTALGMGIDKPDIRFVIHYHASPSLLHYAQEIGRAGRDGKVSWCILLYEPDDLAIHKHLIAHNRAGEHYYQLVLAHLSQREMSKKDLSLSTGLPNVQLRMLLADLEDQGFIEEDSHRKTYLIAKNASASQSFVLSNPDFPQFNFSLYKDNEQHKLQELRDVQEYAEGQRCYTQYLVNYMGDSMMLPCGGCGVCQKTYFPFVHVSGRMRTMVTHFLDEEYLPPIEQISNEQGIIHNAGWVLSFHGVTRIGKLVYMSKYASGGPFALSIVLRAVEIIKQRYPIHLLTGVVSIPSTQGTMLVEFFARQVAEMLSLEYLPLLVKARLTQKQKQLTNSAQKSANVKDAFTLLHPEQVIGRTLLLIDDIYDSGYTLREGALTLLHAGARGIYPFTITRTFHSDNQ